MIERHDIILAGERAFARRVALGVIVTSELSAWHFSIPFMFIFDFLKRVRATRQYSQQYMFLRTMALDAAANSPGKEGLEGEILQIENTLDRHQKLLNLPSQDLLRCRMRTIHLLVDGYTKMLNGNGESYSAIVRSAYPDREDYAQHLAQLSVVEEETDLLLIELTAASEKHWKKVAAEHRQLNIQREKDLDIVY